MALTFPLALPNLADLLPLESTPWNLAQYQEYSGLGTGEGLAHDLGPPLWEAECSTGPMYHDDAYAVQARLNALIGSVQTFMLHNPAKPGPRMDQNGTILATGAGGPSLLLDFINDDAFAVASSSSPVIGSIAANRKEVTISGLPNGYVLSGGDFFQVNYGAGRVALIQIVVSKTAVGGVASMVEVTPHLRPGINAGSAITLIKPAAKVKLVPNTLRLENIGGLHSRLRFTARQTLAAG